MKIPGARSGAASVLAAAGPFASAGAAVSAVSGSGRAGAVMCPVSPGRMRAMRHDVPPPSAARHFRCCRARAASRIGRRGSACGEPDFPHLGRTTAVYSSR